MLLNGLEGPILFLVNALLLAVETCFQVSGKEKALLNFPSQAFRCLPLSFSGEQIGSGQLRLLFSSQFVFVVYKFVQGERTYKNWQTWPITEGIFYGGSIGSVGRRGGFSAEILYSYGVQESFYGGTDKRYFATESEAERFLKMRSESPFAVRYKPSEPDCSLLA